ncbi:MAG: MarR family transcriptional regulator [Microvirga sp.]|nr:MarR family transcriptional regulator [Microvirga sp.]
MSASRPAPVAAAAAHHESEAPVRREPAFDLIELFFFAYRDFVADPDRILVEYGFGRAHHRVLHFVARQPGLTIAELLDVLKITKQSLNRVLKELIEKDFVESRTGTTDRRQRLLHATPQGRDLALRLAEIQSRRIAGAVAGDSGADTQAMRDCVARFLLRMVDEEERARVHALASTPPRRNDPSATGE